MPSVIANVSQRNLRLQRAGTTALSMAVKTIGLDGAFAVVALPNWNASETRSKAMHYRNGREAKNGDRVIQLGTDGSMIVAMGVLHNATPGNNYCNGSIAPIHGPTGACMCDCLHADDLAAILKEKGLDKRPAGK